MVEGAGDEASHILRNGILYLYAAEPVHEAELKDHEFQVLAKGHLGGFGKITECIADGIEIVHVFWGPGGAAGIGIERHHKVCLRHPIRCCHEQVFVDEHALGRMITHHDVMLDAWQHVSDRLNLLDKFLVENQDLRLCSLDRADELPALAVPVQKRHGAADERTRKEGLEEFIPVIEKFRTPVLWLEPERYKSV